jgi:hypothetical protein
MLPWLGCARSSGTSTVPHCTSGLSPHGPAGLEATIHLDGIERQLDALDARLEQIAQSERWSEQVKILTRFRGISTLTAL